MKRKNIFLLIALCILFITGCGDNGPAAYTPNFNYNLGETIEILDKESNALLATVTVTDVIVIKDEPFTTVWSSGNSESYEATIQINYTCNVLADNSEIGSNNFTVKDCNGQDVGSTPFSALGDPAPYTDKYFIADVKAKGDMVSIFFSFYPEQGIIAQITGQYSSVLDIAK